MEIFPYLAVGKFLFINKYKFYIKFPLCKGIPEINVDPFEPLTLDRVSVSKGSGPITLAGSLYDLHITGPSNSTPSATE